MRLVTPVLKLTTTTTKNAQATLGWVCIMSVGLQISFFLPSSNYISRIYISRVVLYISRVVDVVKFHVAVSHSL